MTSSTHMTIPRALVIAAGLREGKYRYLTRAQLTPMRDVLEGCSSGSIGSVGWATIDRCMRDKEDDLLDLVAEAAAVEARIEAEVGFMAYLLQAFDEELVEEVVG